MPPSCCLVLHLSKKLSKVWTRSTLSFLRSHLAFASGGYYYDDHRVPVSLFLRKYLLGRAEFIAWLLRHPEMRNVDGIKHFFLTAMLDEVGRIDIKDINTMLSPPPGKCYYADYLVSVELFPGNKCLAGVSLPLGAWGVSKEESWRD